MPVNGEKVKFTIYKIVHEEKPVYVGCTRTDLPTRLYRHFSSCRQPNNKYPFYKFLRQNQDVTIEALEEFEITYNEAEGFAKALDRERHYVYFFRSQGYSLYNSFKTGKNSPNYQKKPTKEATVLSKNLRTRRKQLDLTQESAAKAIGIKRSLLAAYEEARAEPTLNRFLRIMELYNVADVTGFIKKEIKSEQSKLLSQLALLQQSA